MCVIFSSEISGNFYWRLICTDVYWRDFDSKMFQFFSKNNHARIFKREFCTKNRVKFVIRQKKNYATNSRNVDLSTDSVSDLLFTLKTKSFIEIFTQIINIIMNFNINFIGWNRQIWDMMLLHYFSFIFWTVNTKVLCKLKPVKNRDEHKSLGTS